MATYVVDTSALVKRYVQETGSAWVETMLAPTAGHAIYVLEVTAVEVTSAVIRRQRGGTLSPADAVTILTQFRTDLTTEYQGIAITPTLLATAVAHSETYGLRAYDAMHLAGATLLQAYRAGLDLSPLILLSADEELNAAATAAGLLVDNPNIHP